MEVILEIYFSKYLDIASTSCEIGHRWVPENHIDGKTQVNYGSGNCLLP